MPHSLRAKIKGLRHKGIITDKDCDRLCKALDNENVLDKIRTREKMKPHSWYYNEENPNSSWMICSNCMVTLYRNTDWIFCPYCGDVKDKED